ncbi:insulinase family protein [Prolixibacteraceae bacterium JC049]|nr:insulinase family protein [Prolixibacteraceae bacterium JC049]
MSRSIFFYGVMLACFLMNMWASATEPLKVTKFKLENGFTVFLHEDHSKPEVFGAVITKAGGKNDPEDATGMAHYQEHMLFKGTQTLGTTNWEKEKLHIDAIFKLYDELGKTSDEAQRKTIQKKINEESLKAAKYAIPNEMSNLINQMGGTNLNAGTGPDNTIFYNAFPPNQMERWLDLYSHRFMNPVFRSFQAELETVYEEKNMYQDSFIDQLLENFNARFFKKHPYGQQTIIGTTNDLKNPSLTKMYEFFRTYYVANNMALVLSGDFNSEEIMPIVKAKFGRLKSGVIPEAKEYVEAPFKGREFHSKRLTPIKMGLLGFRTPKKGSEDFLTMEVCNLLLSNENQTGILDELTLENKLMEVQLLPMPYNDYGCTIMLAIPKIIGQKTETAEKLVIGQLKKLKEGQFDEELLGAVKNQLYKQYAMTLESNEDVALLIADAFGAEISVEELKQYPEKLKQITKKDIVAAANKYYGDNYLAFHSKMGFPSPEKMAKPDYKPLKVNTNAVSEYAKHFKQIKHQAAAHKFIDLKEKVKVAEANNVEYFVTKNPKNNIFSLVIQFGVGQYRMPILKHVAAAMDYAGTEDYDVAELKKQFSLLGCSYMVSSDDHNLTIEMDGLEENLEKALELLEGILHRATLGEEVIDILVDDEKSERKLQQSEVAEIAESLVTYMTLGDNSPYKKRLKMKQLKKLTPAKLLNALREATNYEAKVHYVGNMPNVTDKIKSTLKLAPAKAALSPEQPPLVQYNENVIYLLNKKKAIQSNIYFVANGQSFNKANQAEIDAFNMYFGGGFSGLALQEIREYRSLAYTAFANYITPSKEGFSTLFLGYIGTQADKTTEAITVFNELVRDMPQKPERMEMINDFLVQSAISSQPSYRELSEMMVEWRLKGFNADPNEELLPEYKKLKFDDIVKFWEKNIKDKPIAIGIVADKKSLDLKKLRKFGKIIEVKESNIFSK